METEDSEPTCIAVESPKEFAISSLRVSCETTAQDAVNLT